MLFRFKILIFLFIACFFVHHAAHSQSVGLVLSGGGAKGIAHIGVIKALEENNIPIDYIVGTSIGAIIGSMYACGYTTEEMTEMILADEFYNWSKGEIPEQFYYFYKKNNEHADMFGLKFRKRQSSLSLAIPTNLVANQPMDMG
ncbi:MAG: patatin, partial [Bacteroidales bacterium]|nr:patatin [Bacteroidales bacterium]